MKSGCNTGSSDKQLYAGIRQNPDRTIIEKEAKMHAKQGILIGGGMPGYSKKLSERNSKK